MRITGLLIVMLILHAGFNISGIFLNNIRSTEATYGGSSGFLPGGDESSFYGRTMSFLDGGDGSPSLDAGLDTATGGVGFLGWMFRTPVCTMTSATRITVGLTIFNYDLLDILPREGFGNWIRIIVHAVGTIMTLLLASRLFGFLRSSGILTNFRLLATIGVVSGIGVLGSLGGLQMGC